MSTQILADHLANLRSGGDDAHLASCWFDVKALAASELKRLDVDVSAFDPFADTDDPMPEPLEYGWASTSEEVVTWTLAAGLDFRIGLSPRRFPAVILSFDGKPEDAIRAGLKDSGFSYVKARKEWQHGLYGDNTKPESKAQQTRRGELPVREERAA